MIVLCAHTECPDRRYGLQCLSRCMCENNGRCDPVDGHCNCTAGWMGSVCDQRMY